MVPERHGSLGPPAPTLATTERGVPLDRRRLTLIKVDGGKLEARSWFPDRRSGRLLIPWLLTDARSRGMTGAPRR